MGPEAIKNAIKRYGLQPKEVMPATMGYRNRSYPVRLSDNKTVNFVLYKNEPGILGKIQSADGVSNYLAGKGFPARKSLDPKILCIKSRRSVRYGALYTYLSGTTLSWDAYTKDHIKCLGMAMSDMHAYLRGCDTALPDITEEYDRLLGRMGIYFQNDGVRTAMRRKLGVIIDNAVIRQSRQVLKVCKQLPGQQVLHMDFVRGNILFQDTQNPTIGPYRVGKAVISGILDFEKTGAGHPLLDIARTLAFLLVDCRYKPEQKIRKYFLLSGYSKRGASDFHNVVLHNNRAPAINVLENLLDLFLLHDFYKFLRHNPYESLGQNEHYNRTTNLLLRRGIIRLTNVKMGEVTLTGV